MRLSLCTIALSGALALGLTPGISLLAQDAGTAASQTDAGQGGWHHGGGHGPMTPDVELTHLTKMLNLSNDQRTQVRPILQDRHDQMMQIHQDASLAQPDKMAKMKALDADSNTKLEALLNDQQKSKYEKMIQHRQEQMERMRAERQSGGAPPADGSSPQPQ
jgi:protein CpxP